MFDRMSDASSPHLPDDRLVVSYAEAMAADGVPCSPSARKPRLVVADLRAAGLPIAITPPAPATRAQLSLAHDAAYVDAVLDLRCANGFGDRSPNVARSLPFTTGAMLAAARAALERRVALAPVSGFHHASFAAGAGFCTFNGLAVTAFVLLAERRVERVAILDCDMHYGDGTADVLRRRDPAGRVLHATAGARFGARTQASAFFRWLEATLDACASCDLVLYQAGADPHVDDPLGGFLDDAELERRDALVFRRLAAVGVPVAWNLAGGYQRDPDGSIPKVLAIHRRTARACIEAYGLGASSSSGPAGPRGEAGPAPSVTPR